MIVYRKNEKAVPYGVATKNLLGKIAGMESRAAVSHEDVQDLLIEWGEFESAVTDALFPERDSVSELTRLLRKASIYTGHLLAVSWDRKAHEERYWLDMLKSITLELEKRYITKDLKIREQEGYAHYGLYPETYLEAAREFYRDLKPASAVCVGLRSIGASLSCVVGAALERCGCEVFSYTLRPRGHPFERVVDIDKRLSEEFAAHAKSFFLVMDEGPGKSGTSICGAADALSALGIPDERIVIFPSWNPDGSNFLSGWARERWARHRRYAGDFKRAWMDSGRLYEGFPEGDIKEVSAGMWRRLFYNRHEDYPCAHPQHEKRKFLVSAGGSNASSDLNAGRKFLCRFAGLGRYGRARFERARAIEASGAVPKPLDLKNGFMVTEFVEGRPLAKGDINQLLLDRMAQYLAFINKNLHGEGAADFALLKEMALNNISIGLGNEWTEGLDIDDFRGVVDGAPTASVDARMLPHEWLLTRKGYIKADAFDHSTDQFFPRSQDIAWDLAGSIIEFELNPMQSDYLLTAYESFSRGDHSIRKRLPFYFISYCAYGLGYSVFATQELNGTVDGKRFESRARFYSENLKRELEKVRKAPLLKNEDRITDDDQNRPAQPLFLQRGLLG